MATIERRTKMMNRSMSAFSPFIADMDRWQRRTEISIGNVDRLVAISEYCMQGRLLCSSRHAALRDTLEILDVPAYLGGDGAPLVHLTGKPCAPLIEPDSGLVADVLECSLAVQHSH